jgi:hypothetical protein
LGLLAFAGHFGLFGHFGLIVQPVINVTTNLAAGLGSVLASLSSEFLFCFASPVLALIKM